MFVYLSVLVAGDMTAGKEAGEITETGAGGGRTTEEMEIEKETETEMTTATDQEGGASGKTTETPEDEGM